METKIYNVKYTAGTGDDWKYTIKISYFEDDQQIYQMNLIGFDNPLIHPSFTDMEQLILEPIKAKHKGKIVTLLAQTETTGNIRVLL